VPELPEVETLRRSLVPLMVGRKVVSANLHRRDVFTLPSKRSRVLPEHLLVNATITGLQRRGKQMALLGDDGRVLLVHLGMTGQVLSDTSGNHVHATWELDDGTRVCFRDPRRFGGLWFLPGIEALEERWSELGPDALTITGQELAVGAAGSRRAIKAVLLHQAVLAGVGNIYADEALFKAGVSPKRLATRVKPEEFDRLAGTIREVLERAIEAKGSTLRDYRDASGQAGSAQAGHKVYGRAGLPCVTCQAPLTRLTLAQRTTVMCKQCQK
jgi:formamidopyrimidine-DNA glycosylase